MFSEPQKEHEWLQQLLDKWQMNANCIMEKGAEPQKSTGGVVARSLGGLWIVIEANGVDNGTEWSQILTLGYDEKKSAYVGSFIASMMTTLWLYEGKLDQEKNILNLSSSGPSMSSDGDAKYQDSIEIRSKDEFILRSTVLDDGKWFQFMEAVYTRK